MIGDDGDPLELRCFLAGEPLTDGDEVEVQTGDGAWRRVRLGRPRVEKVEGYGMVPVVYGRGLTDDDGDEVPLPFGGRYRWPEGRRQGGPRLSDSASLWLDELLERPAAGGRKAPAAGRLGPRPDSEKCSFCQNYESETGELVRQAGESICDDCLDICLEILDADPTDTGRRDDVAKLPPEEQLRCSFCSRAESEVRKLVAGPTVFICDVCVGEFLERLES